MNTNAIINDYIEALTERAKMAGDIRNAYAIVFMHGTLMSLSLQPQALKSLQQETTILRNLIDLKINL